MKKWKLINSKTILNTKWLTVKQNDYDIGNGVINKDYYDLERPDYVLVIAKDKSNSVILVQQYRRGVNEILWELPAGWVDQGETPIQAAERELEEETGYKGRGKLLGTLAAQPGFMNMKAYVVEVDIDEEVETNQEHDEDITKESIPMTTIKDMIKNGDIIDMGCIAALHLFLLQPKN